MRKKFVFLLMTLPCIITSAFAEQYVEHNHGIASFNVSMPIDATGYTLQGKNLKGGPIKFTDNGTYVTRYLAHEKGSFTLPTVINLKNKPLIKTKVNYKAIKLIEPNGIDNLFIKIGMATRTENVAGLDPFILKNGT